MIPKRTWWTVDSILTDGGMDGRRRVASEEEAILVSSLTASGLHAPALDFDFRVDVRPGEDGKTTLAIHVGYLLLRPLEKLIKLLAIYGLIDHEDIEDRAFRRTAETKDGFVYEVDFLVPVRVFASSKPDHCHVYLDVELPWRKYWKLCKAFGEAGLLQKRFVQMSGLRKMTMLLKPGLTKDMLEEMGIEIEHNSGPE